MWIISWAENPLYLGYNPWFCGHKHFFWAVGEGGCSCIYTTPMLADWGWNSEGIKEFKFYNFIIFDPAALEAKQLQGNAHWELPMNWQLRETSQPARWAEESKQVKFFMPVLPCILTHLISGFFSDFRSLLWSFSGNPCTSGLRESREPARSSASVQKEKSPVENSGVHRGWKLSKILSDNGAEDLWGAADLHYLYK